MTLRAPLDEPMGRALEHVEAAAAAGRRLAAGVTTFGEPGPVETMAVEALPRLRQMGVETDVLRSRPGCLVVRSTSRTSDAAAACAMVGAWLEALPVVAHGVPGAVAESTCATRGGRACIHTLVWHPSAALDNDGTASPSPLPPLEDGVTTDPAWAHPAEVWPGPFDTAPHTVVATPEPVVVVPETVVPETVVAGPVVAPAADTLVEPARLEGSGAATPAPRSAARHPGRWLWVRRRAWLLVIGLLAGTTGGLYAAGHGSASYSATTLLVVEAGGSTSATASANGAEELAVTYAALIPQDQALLSRLAAELGTSPAAIARRLSVVAESGTALIEVKFSGQAASSAVTGANDVARALTSSAPPGRAIVAGSVAVVSPARTAAQSGSLRRYGLPLGVVLGLAVGAGAALAAERADRRIDDLESLGDAVACSATMAHGGISPAELVRAILRAGDTSVTVVPVRSREAPAAVRLARALAAASDGHPPEPLSVSVSAPFETSPGSLSQGTGATVLVVRAGERVAAVREVASRLRLLGRDPAWAVLVSPGG